MTGFLNFKSVKLQVLPIKNAIAGYLYNIALQMSAPIMMVSY